MEVLLDEKVKVIYARKPSLGYVAVLDASKGQVNAVVLTVNGVSDNQFKVLFDRHFLGIDEIFSKNGFETIVISDGPSKYAFVLRSDKHIKAVDAGKVRAELANLLELEVV